MKNKYSPWLEYGFIFLLVFLIYGNSLFNGFVLDDTLMITQNKFTKEGIKGIPDILRNDAMTGFFGEEKNLLPGGRYRPLSQVMFAIEYQIFGLKPFPGHLINVLLYALAGVVLFIILKRLFVQEQQKSWLTYLPFIASLIFICHPLHTEVVANIKGRDEILALWAFLGTTWFTLRYVERGSTLNLIWVALIAFLGLLAKESVITFIVAVPLTIYFFKHTDLKKTLVLAAPFLLSVIAYFALRYSLFGPVSMGNVEAEILNNPFAGASVTERVATVFMTWLKYFGLMIFPYQLTHDYYPFHLQVVDFSNPAALLGMVISLALIVFALMRLRQRSIWSWSILFFFVVFSIYSNLLINIGAFMNERFVFLPLLGFSVALAYTFQKVASIAGSKNSKTILTAFVLITIVLYDARTIARNSDWKDNYTLFTTDVKVSKNSAKCNVSAGEALIDAAMLPENKNQKSRMLNLAIRYLMKGAELHPRYYGAWDKLSLAYVYQGDWNQAIDGYQNCLALSPKDPMALQNLRYIGDQCLRLEKFPEVRKSMTALLQWIPDDSLGLYGMGVACLNLNLGDSANYFLRRAVDVAPHYAEAWNKLGESAGRFYGDLSKAEEYVKHAYSLAPDNASILENLGVLAGMRQQPRVALDWFLRAYEKNPGNENLIQNIITSYHVLGDVEKEREWAAKLVK